MGNSSSKDKTPSQAPASRQASTSHVSGSVAAALPSPTHQGLSHSDRLSVHLYSNRLPRNSRPDMPFLALGRERDIAITGSDKPPETKAERETRRAEKERQARAKERERSMRDEGVDGGYLVTLGVYTGPEDYSKSVVRQLQIERRLAPFWRGLNEFSESWTEAQLVAAVRGNAIPAADEITAEMARTGSQASSVPQSPNFNVNNLTVPISSRSMSYDSSSPVDLTSSHAPLSSSGPNYSTNVVPSTAQLLRGRAKTLASLATGAKTSSSELARQEVRLPKDPIIHGQPIEAYLYKDASECPICFMYYPPYLNRTRCCDQSICSECFVQIKRPDPHPPEHDQPGQHRPPEEEAESLVSEVACCPFCVTPEFGVSYDPPPFRRGLTYASQSPLASHTSAMSSSSSLSNGARKRAASLSANAPQVVTTDRVRPDWVKKLNDARALALRRSAAATALHNAAYVLGSQGDGQLRGSLAGFGRRRRLLADSPGASGSGTPGSADDGSNDLYPARGSSRRTRVDDLEELMMMEAIRLSIAAEEDRMRKGEKDAKKDAKKKAKEEKKEAKQAEKLARKGSAGNASLYNAATNDSTSTWESSSMARSSSNLALYSAIPEEPVQGKGKAPAQDSAGFIPLPDPTATLNTEFKDSRDKTNFDQSGSTSGPGNIANEAQKHLEESRASIQPMASDPIAIRSAAATHVRQTSNASSASSSFGESSLPSLRAGSNLSSTHGSGLDLNSTTAPQNTPPTHAGTTATPEPMLNFQSLTAMIDNEQKKQDDQDPTSEHIETHTEQREAEQQIQRPSAPHIKPNSIPQTTSTRSRGDSGESTSSAPPPVYVESTEGDSEEITPAVTVRADQDAKDFQGMDFWEGVSRAQEATQ